MSLDVAHGTFFTSHVADCPDVAPECATTFIPPHMHRVQLALTHAEVEADYGLRESMQLAVRVPYDIKVMRVHYTTLDGAPFVPPYGDIHHRDETLTGISDASIGIDFSPHDAWTFGIGTTLPAGHTVPDPIALGREGKFHEHIQFGSGTFEPKLAVQWKRSMWIARGEAKLSLYENSHGYRAPTTFVWSLGPSFRAGRFGIDPRLTGQVQSLGRWSGVVDEGSGFRNAGVRLLLSAPAGSVVVAPGVYREVWSHGLGGQTFRQGTTFSLSLSRAF